MDSSKDSNKKAEKNLKLDAATKAGNANTPCPKDAVPSDATSCISSSGDATTSSLKGSEFDQEALMGDQGMYYYGYYPGYSNSFGEWDETQSYYMPADNYESQHAAIQADSGSLMYYIPGFQAGFQPGYPPYNTIYPGAVIGVDGQYLGQQSYYPPPVFQQPMASPGLYPQSVSYTPDMFHTYPWDSSFLFADGLQANGRSGDLKPPTSKSSFSSRSLPHASSKSSTSAKSTTSEMKGAPFVLDVTPTPAVPKQSFKNLNKGVAPAFSKGYIPVSKIPSFTNQGKGGLLYPTSHANVKENAIWAGAEKVKARNRLHGIGDLDLLNEQNRGPRTSSIKDVSSPGVDLVGSLVSANNENSNTTISTVRKEMYNVLDFPTKYDHALFFVIKSYSEDDIHKSIKYNVWASTPNGNKRLDNAFQVAQEKMGEKGGKCPVFLFFSVNASGQFCGVAEMMGPVDFSKNMDFWQQDKWNGFFPVKWHIIKDVPNPQFRHIVLENNENKPVTNSRDTQEVKFSQGTEMLNIFKSYSSKTSILDDFGFYENRQKAMQQKRSKPPAPNFDCLFIKTHELAQGVEPGDLNAVVSSLQSMELEAGKVKEELPTVIKTNG